MRVNVRVGVRVGMWLAASMVLASCTDPVDPAMLEGCVRYDP
jgi:hypothetical protein